MDDRAPDDHETPRQGDWLEQAEARVLDAAVTLAPRLGWNEELTRAALRDARLSPGDHGLVTPYGARDLAALLSRRHDRLALAALAQMDASALKVRERIHAAVEARIEAAMADEAAVRRANGFLALPPNTALALRLAWESADRLWRWAGDTATDENHYSKRAILSGVMVSTLAARLQGGREQAKTHLSRRIDQVMEFERWKARLPKPAEAADSVAAWLGKLRYARRARTDRLPPSLSTTAPTSDGEVALPPSPVADPTR